MNLYVINNELYTNYDENYSPPIDWDYIKEKQLRNIQIIKAQKAQRAEYNRRAREQAEYNIRAKRAREAEYDRRAREQAEYDRRAREQAEYDRIAREQAEYDIRARRAVYSNRIYSSNHVCRNPIQYGLVLANNNPMFQRRAMLTNYSAPFYGGRFINGNTRITTKVITRRKKKRK